MPRFPVRLTRVLLLAGVLLGPLAPALADPPAWTIEPSDWSDFMPVTGRLDLSGVPAQEPGTLVAAFVGGELRGVAEVDLRFVETLGPLFFLEVWSNGAPDETVTFRAYDPSTDTIVGIVQAIALDIETAPGTPSDPFVWTATAAPTPPDWDVTPSAFENFMAVTGTVFIGEASISSTPGHLVAAFVGEEVRGVAEVDLSQVETYGPLFFLQVYSNESSGEAVTFKVWDAVSGTVLDLAETIVFEHQSTLGTVPDPFAWNAAGGPFAFDDVAATEEEAAVTVDVLANDAGSGSLTVTAVSVPANGTALSNGDGTVTYTPTVDFSGADAFTYTMNDGAGGSATATVTITVVPVNDAPVFESDPVTSVALNTAYVYAVAVSDVDDEALTVTASDLPAWLSLADAGDGTATLAGSPPAEGTYAVALEASDGDLAAEQSFTITVTGSNTAPNVLDDEAETDEDTAVLIDVLENDGDPDGDALTISDVSVPGNGTAGTDGEGSITYMPADDFHGSDSFTYTASDGNGGEATATVTVTVVPINDAPTAATITAPEEGTMISLTGDPETAVIVAWTVAEDVEGDAVSYRWEAALAAGDFSTPLLTVETDATSFEATYGALDAALEDADVEVGESVVLEHRVVASDGMLETAGPVASVTLTRGVLTDAEASPLPTTFAVRGTYPNPSAGRLRIAVELPWSTEITVEVYDVAGRRVATKDERLGGGRDQHVSLDGGALPAGVYVYRLTATAPAASEVATGRFTVVR